MKAAINALTLALTMEYTDVSVAEAMSFATSFFTENAELFSAPAVTKSSAQPVPSSARDTTTGKPGEARDFIHGTYVPVVGEDGLTDAQRNALGNVGLCPNCQQPNNDHFPGCARASGEDPKAITKAPLAPGQ